MEIRHTSVSDLPRLMEIFEDAKAKMRADGNFRQWSGTYPDPEQLKTDISRGVSYVVEDGDLIVGTFAFIPGTDPTYLKIYEGQWLNDEPYGTIHRIASAKDAHGVMDFCLDWCSRRTGNIRIDTHRDNRIMQHILETRGFSYCGIIYLLSGDERLAFQKIV